MMQIKRVEELALSFEGTEQNPHFDRIAFKVKGKRIFATIDEKSLTVNVKLNLVEQEIFCQFDEGIYPVANKFGLLGWTTFDVKKVPENLFFEALQSAYNDVFESKK